jgi:hypothetical protein
VGYCQGMNFVAAMLLVLLADEERAFGCLCALVEDVLPGYYAHAMVAAEVDQLVRAGLAGVTTRPAGYPSGGVPPAAERTPTYLLTEQCSLCGADAAGAVRAAHAARGAAAGCHGRGLHVRSQQLVPHAVRHGAAHGGVPTQRMHPLRIETQGLARGRQETVLE